MPEISVQHQCALLDNLVAVESFGTPIGDLPKQTRELEHCFHDIQIEGCGQGFRTRA